jgi:superfamily II DNA/RNA helicase
MEKNVVSQFITNELNQSLKDRFCTLIKDCSSFDCLVGFFYLSGFHKIYPALENTSKIRILIGIGTNRDTYETLQKAHTSLSRAIDFSHRETKDLVEKQIENELSETDDNREIEKGIITFIDWISNKKLEIRAYPSRKLHAKVYIMTFNEGDRDMGRVITGSSNFTEAGLVDNLEFNVELQRPEDYLYALNKFNQLWNDAVDVSENFVQTIREKTWINPNITPYEIYLKFLYEYFKEEMSQYDELFLKYLPEGFMKLEYQEQAVLNAKKILQEYGGVFISDVVGLGKTYITAMLVSQLDGRTLVIAPPVLLERSNPGSWRNVFFDFKVSAEFESMGKIDDLIKAGTDRYQNIVIDEAHRFRNETTITFDKLAQICRGKRVILVTATPYNNSPRDILSLLKLFQSPRRSTIPNLPNLENFFTGLEKILKGLNRKDDYHKYMLAVRNNARLIREKVLKYLMVRRTRSEIEKYFSNDLKRQGLKFPKVEKPRSLYYQLNEQEDKIFTKTIDLIANRITYARYMPMLYYNEKITPLEQQSQRNMGRFMKILLVKRLESSFYAFKNSIDRFLATYQMFLDEYNKGNVYISKKYANKIFDLLENDDDDAIQKLIDEGKAQKIESNLFTEKLKFDLENDIRVLQEIKNMWNKVTRDPKFLQFKTELQNSDILKNSKLIIFTESKETAEYLYKNLNNINEINNQVLLFVGNSSETIREKVIENFDAKARVQKNDYRILVATEVLAEGVNLHRSNVVINYDIPWNPTRLMQRVGRINRVDTPFDVIYSYNFFPTIQANDEIKLKEAAEAKINAFLTLLGGDAELLTEGEPIGSHELFDKLTSAKTFDGDEDGEETELKYLAVIRDIRDNNKELFDKIKRLPKKARTAKAYEMQADSLITYFRKGKIQKFFLAENSQPTAKELDFLSAAKILESQSDTKQKKLPENFYELLDKNKQAFIFSTTEDEAFLNISKKGRDSSKELLNILGLIAKKMQSFTDEQEDRLKIIKTRLEEGSLPKQTIRKTLKEIQELGDAVNTNPLKVLAVLEKNIPDSLLQSHIAQSKLTGLGKREVILSVYLTK